MSSESNQAVFSDSAVADRFVIRDAPEPQPFANQTVVRVKAVSVNRGEVRRALANQLLGPIGWDFAGVVEQAAANATGPAVGTKVVGMLGAGSWARRIAAPTNAIAAIPESVSFELASTLPVAGLTALHSLYKGGFLLGRSVLVTGATGGTGDFACQLGVIAGANVVATVRTANRLAFAQSLGVAQVVVGEDPSEAAKFGPYDLIIDSVGGEHFGKVLAMLGSRGTCVIFGTTAGAEPAINASKLYATGGASLYGLYLFHELQTEPASIGLKTLAALVASKKLTPHIEVVESWRKVVAIARSLANREFTGKAVMLID